MIVKAWEANEMSDFDAHFCCRRASVRKMVEAIAKSMGLRSWRLECLSPGSVSSAPSERYWQVLLSLRDRVRKGLRRHRDVRYVLPARRMRFLPRPVIQLEARKEMRPFWEGLPGA